MARRWFVVLTTLAPVLALGAFVGWHFTRPQPVITWERARLVQPGMTRSEVNAILGGPPGDYMGGTVVTYTRGSVGEDDSGYSIGTNWWGARGMIQVQFDAGDRVEEANYYPAHTVARVDSWQRLWSALTLDGSRPRHGWIPGPW